MTLERNRIGGRRTAGERGRRWVRRRLSRLGLAGACAAVVLLAQGMAGAHAAGEAASGAAPPFALWDDPERLINAYVQDEVPAGPVASLAARGVDPRTATQPDPALQPTRRPDDGGIAFAANSGQHLTFASVVDALASYRWTLAIVRIDGSTGFGRDATLFTINAPGEAGNIAGTQTPSLSFERRIGGDELVARWRGRTPEGATTFRLASGAVVADGTTWNVVLIHRRHGRLFLSVNGRDAGPSTPPTLAFSSPRPHKNAVSLIGDPAPRHPAFAFDTLVFGQSELSEADVDRIVGWAMWRVDRAAALPAAHPHRAAPPPPPAQAPHRYHYDAAAWDALWARNPRRVRIAHQGEPAPSDEGYTRVFYDDFRVDSVGSSVMGVGGETAIWYAPGWHRTGRGARFNGPSETPDVYAHDPDAQTLTLSVAHDGRWRAAKILSVNNAGHGRSWANGGIFRARVKFPALDGDPGVGYFPAIPWFYNLEHLFWRTGERIEIDAYEFTGLDTTWINGGSSHVHKGQYAGQFGHLVADVDHRKIVGTNAWVDIWDGEFHTWEIRIEPALTYLIVDGIELARVETPKEYLERLYMLATYTLKREPQKPDPEQRHDMVIDFIEILQRTETVETAPGPFTARPTLTGAATVGATLTCGANLPPTVTDVWYYWAADGYPRGFGLDPVYRVTEDDLGARLRCMVKAVGALDQPEAWTDASDVAIRSAATTRLGTTPPPRSHPLR